MVPFPYGKAAPGGCCGDSSDFPRSIIIIMKNLFLSALIILCGLVIPWSGIYAQSPRSAHSSLSTQPPDSARQRLAVLQAGYERRILSDTAYLNGVDSIVLRLFSGDSLEQQLDTYQKIAFGGDVPGKYRLKYYRYLLYYFVSKDRNGSAIYYSEKNNEESIRQGAFEKDELPHSELFAISVYGLNKDYARVFSKYRMLRPRLLAMPGRIASGKESPDGVSLAFGVLDVMAEAAAKIKDTARLNEAILLCEGILDVVRKQPARYKEYMVKYMYTYHTIGFFRESCLGHAGQATDLLETSIGEVRSAAFTKSEQPYYSFDQYMYAFEFYFGEDRMDSARRYLDLVRDLPLGVIEHTNVKSAFLLEGGSRLAAAERQYAAAYMDLRRAYDMKDSAFYAVSSDKDNNLYALARAGDAENELRMTEARKRAAERIDLFLFLLFGALALAAVTVFLVYRSRQRQRLLSLRLGLARNFHDEIGPLLLYADALVRKEMEAKPSPRLTELLGQMGNIMEGVRGISQDLKSNELSTVNSFGKETIGLLEKIKATVQIDSEVKVSNGDRILSHYQYTHLRRIVNELISNSVKHAQCRNIRIRMQAAGRYLTILYSDDGKGLAPDGSGSGIGLRNMEERTALLNGTFQLNNVYPDGYSIDISIPLL